MESVRLGLDVSVRVCRDGDLPQLSLLFPPVEPHRRRHAEANSTYLLAWMGSRPVGHLNLRDRPGTVEVRRVLACAEVNEFAVARDLQNRGIGTAILAVAESLADVRGHARIGLAVGTDNPDAQRLYKRLGYVDSGLGQGPWTGWDEQGREVMFPGPTIYMTKSLR